MYDRGTKDYTNVRPLIMQFAKEMEWKLSKNDHKPHWKVEGLSVIFAHFKREVAEFEEAINSGDKENVLTEACDVALMAMMCLDIISGVEQ